jgi:membrane-bound lytic murein transglycosylase D
MKTMLKRKLYQAGLLSYLLFIAVKNSAQEIQISDTTFIQTDTTSAESVLSNAPVISLNKKAAVFVKTYLKEYNSTLVLAKKRSESYFATMDAVLTRYNLPVELKYMAVVESNLKTTARSRVGATGIWQLMPLTAKALGLKRKKNYDERYNVYKSTVAAARYMRDLHAEFGDWLLAIAAYNAGSGTVNRAIRKSGSRDFWKLQSFLPAETRNYVKKYIGTHYYFEGQGSLTTLTKAETQKHNKVIEEFAASQPVVVTESMNDVADER